MKPRCDRTHITYAMVGVINYAKALDRAVERAADVNEIGVALKRLRAAVSRLEAEKQREKSARKPHSSHPRPAFPDLPCSLWWLRQEGSEYVRMAVAVRPLIERIAELEADLAKADDALATMTDLAARAEERRMKAEERAERFKAGTKALCWLMIEEARAS